MLDSHFEWLAVRESGRSIPLRRDEMEVENGNGRVRFGFVGDGGFAFYGLRAVAEEDGDLVLEIAGEFGRNAETLRLIPRTSAAELSANIELARLMKANELATALRNGFAGLKVVRVALSRDNARLAQIVVRGADGIHRAVLADVTASASHESLLASAMNWLDRLRIRKKEPISEVWIAAEKRQARNLQKLLAMLTHAARASVNIVEITLPDAEPTAKSLRQWTLSDLWREKAKKLTLPASFELSEIARKVTAAAPDDIDVIFSKHGETLRYRGLAFARVRRMMGQEKAWFGTEKKRTPLVPDNLSELEKLISELQLHRTAETDDKRHDLYRLAPESWLESMLKRNIKLLDPNLILSPIYNQFKAATDKIDLLAIRRDGRLVIIELKTAPDRETVFQAADYWRKIEHQRRRGILAKANLFGNLTILDQPALIYVVAPALSFHYRFEEYAASLAKEVELWRWELHEGWREEIKVIARKNYSGRWLGNTNL